MTRADLLRCLCSFLEDATKDLIMPVALQNSVYFIFWHITQCRHSRKRVDVIHKVSNIRYRK